MQASINWQNYYTGLYFPNCIKTKEAQRSLSIINHCEI